MNQYGAKAYHKTAVETASKEKILLMLYESCIRYLKKSQAAMEAKNWAEKGIALGKAQDIVNELTNSLNYEVGGPLAEQLGSLYLHIFQETTKANIDNDPKKIAHCIKILETLYLGWKEAIESLKTGQNATGGQKGAK